jgi:transcriptional regulator with XRE-family HTH domain
VRVARLNPLMSMYYGRGREFPKELKEFGLRLQHARLAAGLSQLRLEELSGVHQTMISRVEGGKSPHVSLERIVRLEMALGAMFPIGTCPHDHACPMRHASGASRRTWLDRD